MRTLTTRAGNPAATLASEYRRLMAIECESTLRTTALSLVVGRPGISDKNAKKFALTVKQTSGLDRLRSYLTNFMLKADGLGVI